MLSFIIAGRRSLSFRTGFVNQATGGRARAEMRLSLPLKKLSCQSLHFCNTQADSTNEDGSPNSRHKYIRDWSHTEIARLENERARTNSPFFFQGD
jgi:hypothetical protein